MDDNLLIDKFLSGDEEGFAMLVKRYQNHVINIVYSLTGRTQDADDIAQEIFIKVYKNLPYFNRKAQFFTWLYRIALNAAYNHLKKEKKYVSLGYVQEPNKRPAEVLEQKERQRLVRKALEKLPFKFRSVIVLKEMEGLSYKDIAKTMGCRIGTVESRLFRARNMLRKILSPIMKEAGEDELR